jgi:bacillithiol system protein YtxJ
MIMAIQQLKTIDDMENFIKQPGKHLLFKHSTTCPISAKAHDEFTAYLEENETSAAVVLVIEDRPVSLEIAEKLAIKHESPQIFLLEDGEVSWNTSHWKITKDSIQEAFSK